MNLSNQTEITMFILKYKNVGRELAGVLDGFSLDLVGIVAEYSFEERCIQAWSISNISTNTNVSLPVKHMIFHTIHNKWYLSTPREIWTLDASGKQTCILPWDGKTTIHHISIHPNNHMLYGIISRFDDMETGLVRFEPYKDGYSCMSMLDFASNVVVQMESCSNEFILLSRYTFSMSPNKTTLHAISRQDVKKNDMYMSTFYSRLFGTTSKFVYVLYLPEMLISVLDPAKRGMEHSLKSHLCSWQDKGAIPYPRIDKAKKFIVNEWNGQMAVVEEPNFIHLFRNQGPLGLFENKITIDNGPILDVCFDTQDRLCVLTPTHVQLWYK